MFTIMERHFGDLRAPRLVFGSGQYLFHLGDSVNVIHLVETGMVHLARHQSDGSALVLQTAGPRSILAEASLYSDTYHCDAVASAATHTLAIAKADFQKHLRERPDLADAWAGHLAHELQRARLHAEILSLKTVAKRLDAWIAWRGGPLPQKGEWKLIADEIGLSPEALYREMANRRQLKHEAHLLCSEASRYSVEAGGLVYRLWDGRDCRY